jgi:nitrogen fixation/metabolism regulation signal transduction histidine kinase
MPPSSARPRRRFSLQVKLAVALVLVVLAPLLVSAYLIDQLGKVAANFASNEAQARQQPMERALDAYRQLFDVTKRLHAEVADDLARRPDLSAGRADEDLHQLLARQPGLVRISLRRPDGTAIAEASRELPGAAWRATSVQRELPGGNTLALAFAVRTALQDEYQELKTALDGARRVSKIRTALPEGYRTTFLALISLAALAAAFLGVVFSATVTRRIGALVTTARRVSAGALEEIGRASCRERVS